MPRRRPYETIGARDSKGKGYVEIEAALTAYRFGDYEQRRALKRAELREARRRFAAAFGLAVGVALCAAAWSVTAFV